MPSSASASMGELLLSGWTMLAEGCAQCHVPLMRNPNGREDICVGCGRRTSCIGAALEAAVPQSPEVGDRECAGTGAIQDAEPELGDSTGGVPTFEQGLPDRPGSPASKLADKMLEGWKMLADHCPRCFTPLCESKAGEVRCVACDLEVRRERPKAVDASATDARGAAADVGGRARHRRVVEGEIEGQENEVMDDMDGRSASRGGLETQRVRVVGGILRYMEGLSDALCEATTLCAGDAHGTSGSRGWKGGDEADDLLHKLDRCAEILTKLDSVRIESGSKR